MGQSKFPYSLRYLPPQLKLFKDLLCLTYQQKQREARAWVRNIALPLPCRKPCRAEQIPVCRTKVLLFLFCVLVTRAPHSRTLVCRSGRWKDIITLVMLIGSFISSPGNMPHMRYAPKVTFFVLMIFVQDPGWLVALGVFVLHFNELI